MASLWIQTREAAAVKIAGRLSAQAAMDAFDEFVRVYTKQKAGRTIIPYARHDAVLLDSKGRPWASLYVEFMSPPSSPEPGERRRETA